MKGRFCNFVRGAPFSYIWHYRYYYYVLLLLLLPLCALCAAKKEKEDQQDEISDGQRCVESRHVEDEMEETEEDEPHGDIVTGRRCGGRSRFRYSKFLGRRAAAHADTLSGIAVATASL